MGGQGQVALQTLTEGLPLVETDLYMKYYQEKGKNMETVLELKTLNCKKNYTQMDNIIYICISLFLITLYTFLFNILFCDSIH